MAETIYSVLSPGKSEQYFHLANQIDNILTSYDDEFDAASEMIQNALDAIIQRYDAEGPGKFKPTITVGVNCKDNTFSVGDNGCGVPPEHFNSVFRPNVSLKKLQGQKNARGEKGAGVVFLQFGHKSFTFATKVNGAVQRYVLKEGPSWFSGFKKIIETNANIEDPAKLPDANMKIDAESAALSDVDRGSYACVEFDENSNLRSLGEISGTDEKTALKRWDYLLRTRTAIGFAANPENVPEPVKSLKVLLTIVLPDGKVATSTVPVGFLYPHVGAGHVSLFTSPKDRSELLYDFIDKAFIEKYLPDFYAVARNKGLIEKYKIAGYVSYAYINSYYEEQFYRTNGFKEEMQESDLAGRLIQVNGGFQVAVREYPNGRLRSFLHRGGSEDKSRTFVLLNFGGAYKPDYGRKNLAHDCRDFVNALCKALMSFATTKERRRSLAVSKAGAPHGIKEIEDARKNLVQDEKDYTALGPFISSAKKFPVRPAASESEVVIEFCHYAICGSLPGYTLFGPSDRSQLDSMFSFVATNDEVFKYEENKNKLGVQFGVKDEKLAYENRWLEFKQTLDQVIDDFKKPAGEMGKKWFPLIHLLVCYSVDSAVDGYSVEEITPQNAHDRLYYGVTHLLRSSAEQSHVIQVICLKSLREKLVKPVATG